jgi:hypothetical protein
MLRTEYALIMSLRTRPHKAMPYTQTRRRAGGTRCALLETVARLSLEHKVPSIGKDCKTQFRAWPGVGP